MKEQLWIPKSFSSEERWNVAAEVLAKLKDTYKESLLAVAVEGSTAKGSDRPQSDLEFLVVLNKEKYHRWHAFFYKGMFVGISYNSLDRIEEKAGELDYEWPVKGDAVATSKVLYDPHNLYGYLREEAEEAEKKADFTILIRDALTDMYEHVYKIFTLHEDEKIALRQEIAAISHWAVMSVGLANRHKFPSNKSMVEDSFLLKNFPSQYETLMKELILHPVTLPHACEIVSKLWTSFAAWGEKQGIDLHDDSLKEI
jgi:kanamycin nucleotidyltransferase